METHQSNLKPLPVSVTKIKLETMFTGQLPSETIRKGINEIIYDKRKNLKGYELLPKKQIIRTHIVLLAELREFIDTYGLPHGYYKPENY